MYIAVCVCYIAVFFGLQEWNRGVPEPDIYGSEQSSNMFDIVRSLIHPIAFAAFVIGVRLLYSVL